jgi:hypothetical protein
MGNHFSASGGQHLRLTPARMTGYLTVFMTDAFLLAGSPLNFFTTHSEENHVERTA